MDSHIRHQGSKLFIAVSSTLVIANKMRVLDNELYHQVTYFNNTSIIHIPHRKMITIMKWVSKKCFNYTWKKVIHILINQPLCHIHPDPFSSCWMIESDRDEMYHLHSSSVTTMRWWRHIIALWMHMAHNCSNFLRHNPKHKSHKTEHWHSEVPLSKE